MTPSQSYITDLYLGLVLFISPFTHAVHILVPLHGKQIFLPAVALLATGDKVVSHTFAAPGDRNDVVHRQLCRWKTLAAVMTEPLRDPATPPSGLSDLSGFILLQLCRLL